MSKIRVLVVDDSVVIRRLVSDVLSKDPDIEVAGVAANGRIALEKIIQLRPDVVTLDVEMPEMDGLQALKHIRRSYPRLAVIMFSTLTGRGAAITIEALSAGASDYVAKPASAGGATAGIETIRAELIPKIKALCGRNDVAPAKSENFKSALQFKVPQRKIGANFRRPEILAIGASTGGPNALATVIPALPANFPVPIVIVQHMPPIFTRLLAERLAASSSIAVREGVEGAEVAPGSAWIAPGNYHMTLEKTVKGSRIHLHQEAPENSCRPAVDVLFRSVVKVYGPATFAVILTGMGKDGFKSCQEIYQAGGQILAQDEASSVVWGMPGLVARAELAHKVMPLDELAREIIGRAFEGRGTFPHKRDERVHRGHFRV
jgi:two-component system chemotaxis response regulator CheB